MFSLGLMRALSFFCIAATLQMLLSCCAIIDGVPFVGAVHVVTEHDIREAIATWRAARPGAPGNFTQIEVRGEGEIVLWYAGGSFDSLRRINGKWQEIEHQIVTS